MTLPSFLAASISCGVIAVAGGAAARTLAGVTSAPAAATADDALSTSRLDHVGFCIAFLLVGPQTALSVSLLQPPSGGTTHSVHGNAPPACRARRRPLAGCSHPPPPRRESACRPLSRPCSHGWRLETPAASPCPAPRSPPCQACRRRAAQHAGGSPRHRRCLALACRWRIARCSPKTRDGSRPAPCPLPRCSNR